MAEFISHSDSLQIDSMVQGSRCKKEAWEFIYKWGLCDMQQNSSVSYIEKVKGKGREHVWNRHEDLGGLS